MCPESNGIPTLREKVFGVYKDILILMDFLKINNSTDNIDSCAEAGPKTWNFSPWVSTLPFRSTIVISN